MKWKWKRLLITLVVGFVPTVIAFLFRWYWGGTIFALLTLLIALTAVPPKVYAAAFTVYALLAIAWVSGSILDGILAERWDATDSTRLAVDAIVGLLIGLIVPAIFWFVNLAFSTKFILTLRKSMDIPFWTAFKYVASVTFDRTQPYIQVANGEKSVEVPKGMLSSLGGPGLLVVSPGNAAVLECGGKITDIVGPGLRPLKRFEYFWKPVETKGIVDLRPQFKTGEADDVRTRDGIPLKFKVGTGFQLEPKHITDQQFEEPEDTRVIGAPEFPVYRATIEKSLYNVPEKGWKDGWFPSDPMHVLRDVVATYTLDQVFSFDRTSRTFSPNKRTIHKIEEEVKEIYAPSAAKGGIWFKGIDIREVWMPTEVEAQVVQKWTSQLERERKVEDAKTESEAMIALSQGRAAALKQLEAEKFGARQQTAQLIFDLVNSLQQVGTFGDSVMVQFMSAVQQITERVGEDESVAALVFTFESH